MVDLKWNSDITITFSKASTPHIAWTIPPFSNCHKIKIMQKLGRKANLNETIKQSIINNDVRLI